MTLTVLDPFNPEQAFPDPESVLTDPDGLLAIGGCLSVPRLLNAYKHGIFPWFNPGEPILWWSPNPRLIVIPGREKVSRSLGKTLRKGIFQVTFDRDFAAVMQGCAGPRRDAEGTWITDDMLAAYQQLHEQGVAHSVEVWQAGALVGGLYGVAIGQVFFGESMFHRQTDASKVAFVTLLAWLTQWGYQLVDCQVHSQHLVSLGAEEVPRATFIDWLQSYCSGTVADNAWTSL